MKIIVACEFSGVVRDAFRDCGHEAYSCDLLSCEGNSAYHFQMDVLDLIKRQHFDLMIAHPPCTDLAVSGAKWFEEKRKDGRQQKAIDFFMALANADIDRICIENPVSIMSTEWRKPDQIIQPWQFGHDASKSTCLWLKGLPPLEHTKIIPPKSYKLVPHKDKDTITRNGYHFKAQPFYDYPNGWRYPERPLWANQTPSGQNKLGPSEDRWAKRAETYAGVAKAMSEQWNF